MILYKLLSEIWVVCTFLAKHLHNFLLRDLKNVCHIMSTVSRHELVQSLKIAPWRWVAWPKARLGSRRNKCDLNSLLLTRVLNSDWGLDATNSNDGTVCKKRREGNFYSSSPAVSFPVAHWPHLRHHRVRETKHLENTGEISAGKFPQMEHKGGMWGRSCLPASQTAAPHGVCAALEPLFKGFKP